MCGIAGWVDFTGLPESAGRTVAAMVSAMDCPGPAKDAVFTADLAVLGQRRLGHADGFSGGERIRAAGRDSAGRGLIAWTGDIANMAQLCAELTVSGQRVRDLAAGQTLLRAYLAWGGERLAGTMEGGYAIALWDNERQELLLIRDRLGLKPLYYSLLPTGVMFGSVPRAILAHPMADRTIDADGLRELFADVKTPGAAVLHGMAELRPGHLLRVRRAGAAMQRYWKLEAREYAGDVESAVIAVRRRLTETVAWQSRSDPAPCTLLSGGLDSSAVTALTAQAVRAHGDAPVRSFAVDFSNLTESVERDLVHPVADSPYADEVAGHVGTEHRRIVIDIAEMTRHEVRREVAAALDWPTFLGNMDTSLYLLCRSVSEYATVALTGDLADEIFGGHPWFHIPAYTQSGTLPWTLAHNIFMPTLFSRVLADLDVYGYQREQLLAAAREVPALPGESPADRRMREFTYYFITRFGRLHVDRQERLGSAAGLAIRSPFCDHRLAEFVFNLPWRMKSFDGREKSLLRAAVRDLLPASVFDRPKSGYPVVLDAGYDDAIRKDFLELAADAHAPVLPLLNPDVLRSVRAEPGLARRLTRMEIDQALHLNEWLRLHKLRLQV